MNELICFLEKWQTLFGAIIGAIAALLVAFLVAHQAKRREDVSAAMLLVGSLGSVVSAGITLKTLSVEEKIEYSNLPYWHSAKLARHRPKLSPVFEASRVRLMPAHTQLAVHLELFQTIWVDLEEKLDKLAEDLAQLDEKGEPKRSIEQRKTDAIIIFDGFLLSTKHAKCAQDILTWRILSSLPTFHTLRYFLLKRQETAGCKKLFRSA